MTKSQTVNSKLKSILKRKGTLLQLKYSLFYKVKRKYRKRKSQNEFSERYDGLKFI